MFIIEYVKMDSIEMDFSPFTIKAKIPLALAKT